MNESFQLLNQLLFSKQIQSEFNKRENNLWNGKNLKVSIVQLVDLQLNVLGPIF